MSINTSRLRGGGRRTLGSPPTDGTPGIEQPIKLEQDGQTNSGSEKQTPVMSIGSPEQSAPALTSGQPGPSHVVVGDGRSEGSELTAVGASKLGAGSPRRRVPPPEAEPRIPFTTRVALSTKERLEDACYHLRIKHQVFIDEAIRLHLQRNGF